MIAELKPNGVVNTYLWGYDLAASQRNGQHDHYYIYNGRGDVTALANQAGTITKRGLSPSGINTMPLAYSRTWTMETGTPSAMLVSIMTSTPEPITCGLEAITREQAGS